jgi:hypothetical protein
MKKRYTIYLSKPVADRFDWVARDNGAKSALIELALKCELDPQRLRTQEEAMIRRLDAMSKQTNIIERDVAIVTETLSLFVRYFLMITPPVAKADQDAARALGKERFQTFVAQVGRRLGSDHRLVSEVLETIVASRPDLLAEAADEAPSRPTPSAEIKPFPSRAPANAGGTAPSTPKDHPHA